MQEETNFVVCRICGIQAGSLSRHLGVHNIKAVEYLERYPGAKIVSDASQKARTDKLRAREKIEPRLICKYCGSKFEGRIQRRAHERREESMFINGKEGQDFISCKECGHHDTSIIRHIKTQHGMSLSSYREKHSDAVVVLDSIVNKRAASIRAKGGFKPISEKRDAVQCPICTDWYQPETAVAHREKCVAEHPDKYTEGEDYVKCPECQKAFLSVGRHLREIHGWDNDKIVIETGRGLKLISNRVVIKRAKETDYEAAQYKREQTHLDRHGFANPFADPAMKEKIVETSQRRYGTDHPMQNEEVLIRQNESAHNGQSGQEKFFDEHTCDSIVFTGYGGRFIRVKTGVRKYGRVVKNLNPDFMVFPDNVLESALAASKERRKMSREKHRSKYVIELLGDWYHSEQMIGVKPEEHEAEIVAAYKSVGIECLTLWEKDVMGRWEIIRPMVDAWVAKAVADMNEHPIFSRATKNKVDKRIGTLACPWGSGKVFREQAALDRWLASPVNFWRPGLLEGKEYVRCLECANDVRVGKIGEHLRQIHGGMTKEDYLLKHPGALLVSSRVVDLIGQNAKDRVGNTNVKRTAYRCPDGSIVGKRDAWIREWGVESPPADSIVDGSLYNPWSGKIEGEDFVVCAHCGYRASNLVRHLKKEHGGLEGYSGQVKSKKCVENLSTGAYTAWDTKGRHEDVSLPATI